MHERSLRAPARVHAKEPGLPGLNGRSVRNLRQVRIVRSLRRMLVSVIAALGLLLGASVVVPAYAQIVQEQELPAPQLLTIATADLTAAPAVERDDYTATPPAPLQWPVERHSLISDGFGPRTPPCDGCSSFHSGVDFDAGWGAEVRAIAAGVVVETDDPFYTSFGTHLTIQHLIDGQVITSLYGHLQAGSMPLRVGDTVYPGQLVGLLGSTGASTGPHLHLEIRINGTDAVDPYTWLRARLG